MRAMVRVASPVHLNVIRVMREFGLVERMHAGKIVFAVRKGAAPGTTAAQP